jgi:hypothetical protein
MIEKVKALAIAFVAVVASGALATAGAHAGTLDIGTGPAVLKGNSDTTFFGSQQHLFSFNSGSGPFNAVCDSASFEGETFGTSIQEAAFTPTYASCKLAGMSAVFQMNGCRYTIQGTSQAVRTFDVNILGCTAGKQIQIKTALCTVDIPEQIWLHHLTATNLENNAVTFEATLTGMTATLTGAACPGGNGAPASASLSGNTIVRAFKAFGKPKVTKHGHEYIEVTGGEQVSLLAT